MAGVNGDRFLDIRAHLQTNIGQVYKDMDTSYVTINGSKIALLKL